MTTLSSALFGFFPIGGNLKVWSPIIASTEPSGDTNSSKLKQLRPKFCKFSFCIHSLVFKLKMRYGPSSVLATRVDAFACLKTHFRSHHITFYFSRFFERNKMRTSDQNSHVLFLFNFNFLQAHKIETRRKSK